MSTHAERGRTCAAHDRAPGRWRKAPAGVLLAAALTATGWTATQAQTAAPDLSTKALVPLVTTYVSGYEQQFSFVVADETTEQRVMPSDTRQPEIRRVTRGELFLWYIAADSAWIAVHDVAEVDGTPVEDREDLRALLQEGSVRSVAAHVLAHNAKYNIGRVGRNFNEPTLAFLVLGDNHRPSFSFSRGAIDRQSAPGSTFVTIDFRERDRPTIIRGTNGKPVYSSGHFMIDAATGRVQQMQIGLKDDTLEAQLSTTFTKDANLDLWVPSVFTERYAATVRASREVTTCISKYTNYRRFQVRGRIQ